MNNLVEGDGVRKSLVKLMLVAAGLLLSSVAQALGTGGINVTSALGQPLQADIELVAVTRADRAGLEARLASSEDYKAAGLEYPHGSRFKFNLETKPDGEPYIKVTSDQPITDPFVSLLVELTWPSGRLLREYTFLLDPPGYEPDQPAMADLRVVAPAAEVTMAGTLDAVEPMPALPEEQAMSEGDVMPAMGASDQPMAVAPTEAQQPESSEVAGAADGSSVAQKQPVPQVREIPPPVAEPLPSIPEWVTVPRGSTMYELADQYKTSDVSVERMLVAMYRANADEFGGRNMNRIKAGKILRLPDTNEIDRVTQSDAKREIRVQTADWNAYRQKLASAATVTSQPVAVQQVAVGKINSSVIDKAPIAKETAKEVLKLSKGEAPGDQAIAGAGGKGMTAQEQKNAVQEDAIAKAKALEEEEKRTALLDQNLKLLAQLQAEKAELEAKLLATQAAKPEAAPAPQVVPENKVKVETTAKPPVKPVVPPQPVSAPEPALLDQILEEPLYLAGGAGTLLVLGGVGFLVYRRKKKPSISDELGYTDETGDSTGRLTAPVVPSPDTGDFTQTVVTTAAASAGAGSAAQEPESVDPISEADLFLSFGRDGQAEEILKDALQTMPSNHQIHLKLLGIYSSRQDVDAFSGIARLLKDSGDEYAWEQAVEMGRKLEPNNPMYGGTGSDSMEDTTSATIQTPVFDIGASDKPAALDMDFDLNQSSSPAAEESAAEQNFMSDDLETTTVLSSSAEVAPEEPLSMDFDITSTSSAGSGQAEDEGMVFDVTGSHSSPASEPESITPDSDLGMAFTMDFPVETEEPKPAPPPLTADLSGINLNFDDEPAASPAAEDEQSFAPDVGEFDDVTTKLDLAKAYQEMGDSSGAREILDEVIREGNDAQRQAAQEILDQLY